MAWRTRTARRRRRCRWRSSSTSCRRDPPRLVEIRRDPARRCASLHTRRRRAAGRACKRASLAPLPRPLLGARPLGGTTACLVPDRGRFATSGAPAPRHAGRREGARGRRAGALRGGVRRAGVQPAALDLPEITRARQRSPRDHRRSPEITRDHPETQVRRPRLPAPDERGGAGGGGGGRGDEAWPRGQVCQARLRGAGGLEAVEPARG